MRKLLIANRAEIACRVMRTAHALGIATVAVFSDPDAGAPHVELADEAVHLPGATPADTYLRGDAIIAAARSTGADAIHPGYGFLSENAAFAAAVTDAGLTFVGPRPDAITAMGAKIGAKALMDAAGVPVLPGGEVTDTTDLDELAARVGFPMLVKASFGGGGRGMRRVDARADLDDAIAVARREAAAAFGDGTVFIERYVIDPRHIEVQIVGDTHGTVVHLFERECSIQRRYQKILEEAPSPAVDDELRAALGAAAVAAGKTIGYVGAGTVEFVLDPAGAFYFLEVNTRLQVEHPVTELVTGLDLVEMQLRIADGEPLPREVLDARITGHAIEARLYAEDVTAGFRPATGVLHRFEVPAGNGVRVDAGYTSGSPVSPHYDAMLAKIIGYGRSRPDAAQRLARALDGTRVHGVVTNRDLLAAILREPDFLAGRTDTGYLDRHDPAAMVRADPDVTRVHALVAALARQAGHRSVATVLGSLPSGWRNIRSGAQRVEYEIGDVRLAVAYRIAGARIEATVDGVAVGDAVLLVSATADAVRLEIDSVRRTYQVHRVGPEVFIDGPAASSTLIEVDRFPDPGHRITAGSLLAPMPGMVVSVLTEAGTAVAEGAPLIILEAMKMQHTVSAPADGTVTEIRVAPGDQVERGMVLVVVTEPERTDAG